MPKKAETHECGCGCGGNTTRGEFIRGHAVQHALALRATWDTGRTGAIRSRAERELQWRGWMNWNAGQGATEVVATGFGVEAEFFGIDRARAVVLLRSARLSVQDDGYHHNVRDYWRITHDGSVHGEGNELVSPILRMNKAPHTEQVKRAVHTLRDNGAKLDKTCGLHVHHSGTGMTPLSIAECASHYYLFQSAIDSILPKSRRSSTSNDYFGETGYIEALNQTLRDPEITLAGAIAVLGRRNRYEMVNLQSLSVHRSIEFRQHSATLNATKISNWVKLTRLFMDIGKSKSVIPLLKGHDFSVDAIREEYKDIVKVMQYLGAKDDLIEFFLERRDKFVAGTEDDEDKAVLGDVTEHPQDSPQRTISNVDTADEWCASCNTYHVVAEDEEDDPEEDGCDDIQP